MVSKKIMSAMLQTIVIVVLFSGCDIGKKKKFADYVLSWKPGTRVAVIESKDNNCSVSHGLQQALGYAEILGIPSAFSSNGDAFACHNKVPEDGEDIVALKTMTAYLNIHMGKII